MFMASVPEHCGLIAEYARECDLFIVQIGVLFPQIDIGFLSKQKTLVKNKFC